MNEYPVEDWKTLPSKSVGVALPSKASSNNLGLSLALSTILLPQCVANQWPRIQDKQ